MGVYDYDSLRVHVGHKIACVMYGRGQNVAVECETCHVVLLDFDRYTQISEQTVGVQPVKGRVHYPQDRSGKKYHWCPKCGKYLVSREERARGECLPGRHNPKRNPAKRDPHPPCPECGHPMYYTKRFGWRCGHGHSTHPGTKPRWRR